MGSGERVLVPSPGQPRTGVVFLHHEAIRRVLGEQAEDYGEHVIEVRIEPEPTNPEDANAIVVRSHAGETLGYLPRPLAAMVRLDKPLSVAATVRGGGGIVGSHFSPPPPFRMTLHVDRRPS